MPITPNHLTTDVSEVAQAAFNTASITPGANRLVLLWASGRHGASIQNAPTVSGNGLTWEFVTDLTFGTTDRFCLFKAMGANPSSGAVTITWPATMAAVSWSIIEFSGASYTLPQAVTNTGSSQVLIVTLSAFGDAVNNYSAGGFYARTDTNMSVGGGFSLGGNAAAVLVEILSEYKAGQDTSVDASAQFGFQAVNGGIAVEIAVASGGSGGGGQGKGGGGGISGGGIGRNKDKDKGGGKGPPGTIDKYLVGSRSRRRIGTL